MNDRQKLLMARNLFMKHAGISRGEAIRLVEKLPKDALFDLCQAKPADAEVMVKRVYNEYLIALGRAAEVEQAQEVVPELGDDAEAVTPTEQADDFRPEQYQEGVVEEVEEETEGVEEKGEVNPGLE